MKKWFAKLITGCITLAAFSIAISAITLGWFSGNSKKTDKEVVDGQIGLRGYFFAGNGTQETPYEIVDPVHFYNLARLQNLGIFTEKNYFQIGHIFDPEAGPQCRHFDGDTVIYDNYLDMGAFCAQRSILPIGSEGTPFVGTFDGNGLPVRNLTIKGYPEDIGVFGYVSYEGVVENLVCDNLTIVSLGYNTTDDSADLFGAEIDDLFNIHGNASYLTTDMSLAFYDHNGAGYVRKELKRRNLAPIVSMNNIDSADNLFPGTTIYKGYFLPTYPNIANDKFTYSWKSSSSLISSELVDLHNTGELEEAIVFNLEALRDSTDFNSGKDMESDARISLVASVEVDGFVYSRVIQTYNCEFNSNSSTYGDGDFSVTITCDYAADGTTPDAPTGYHHGNNIGFLCGHLNGLMQHCYVYNGSFKFNENGYHAIKAESDMGLVGEVGKNVINTLDPELSLVTNGDIGIMNFSKIYNSIRTDFKNDDTTKAGLVGSTSFISYHDKLVDGALDRYGQYLRHNAAAAGEEKYITYTDTEMSGTPTTWHDVTFGSGSGKTSIKTDFNSIDFIWNKVIEDENVDDNIFGVFKVATSYVSGADESTYNAHYLDGIGLSRIINGSPKTKVYFSTAEFDEQNPRGGSFVAYKATTIPTVDDINSFNYPFSRDFNYCFELDLAQMNSHPNKHYMFNTELPFLQNYLSNILIDKFGRGIAPGNSRFGFMFRSSDNEPLASLSSYMPVRVPDGTNRIRHKDKEGNTVYYPANSIVFDIDAEYGANVSIAGNGEDICIYGYDPSESTGNLTKLYSMKAKPDSATDKLRYFPYNFATGETGTTIVTEGEGVPTNLSDSGALYGHIFKLPRGHYVVGARSGNAANIYFLAVQGQNNASIGSKDMAFTGTKLEDVDFLTKAPTIEDFRDHTLEGCLLTFESTYNTVAGQFYIDVYSEGNKRYLRMTFSDSPLFVTRLFVYSQTTEHTYYINGEKFDRTPTDYPRPSN